MADADFKFLDPGKLIDQDLELVLVKTTPAMAEKQYVPSYHFNMVNVDTHEEMGEITLRIGDNEGIYYGGHMGYGVHEKFRGHQYAARSCRLLFPLAKKHGINPLWITCNPDNIASRKVCEAIGGTLVEIIDLPEHNDQYQRGERQKCRYRVDL